MKRPAWLNWGHLYFVLMCLFMYAPILLLIVFSFNDSTSLSFPLEGFTTRWYRALIDSGGLVDSLKNSLLVGLASSALATLLGTMAAIGITRFSFRGRNAFLALASVPLVIPSIVLGVALLILFRQFFDLDLSLWTVGLSHVVISMPIAMLIVASRLAGVQKNLEEAAMDLGASFWGAQWRVTVPISLPALLAAFLTCFTTSFDEYAMSVFLAGTEATLPIYVYSQLRFPRRLPHVVTLAAVVMLSSAVLVILAEWLRRNDPIKPAAHGDVE